MNEIMDKIIQRPIHDKIYSPENELEKWKIQYLGIQENEELKSPESGPSPTPGPEAQIFDERRADPRIYFMPVSMIYAHMGPRAFPILNISISGIAFHSDMYIEPGAKLLMSALGMIALEVEVLSSDMEETDSELMEFKYRVRAKFGPHVNGFQVYVLSREMHMQNQKGKSSPKVTLEKLTP